MISRLVETARMEQANEATESWQMRKKKKRKCVGEIQVDFNVLIHLPCM